MTIPATRSAGAVLGEHTTLVVRCIDRLYLNLYQPRLQYEGGVVGFFRERGFPIASSALMINMHFSSKMSPAATQDSTLIRCACAFE